MISPSDAFSKSTASPRRHDDFLCISSLSPLSNPVASLHTGRSPLPTNRQTLSFFCARAELNSGNMSFASPLRLWSAPSSHQYPYRQTFRFGAFHRMESVCDEAVDKLDTSSKQIKRLTITRPDDWHLHLRDGDALPSVVPHSASTFGRAIIMPNLKPPVTTVAAARAYRERILSVLPSSSEFEPLMTLYLTDSTTRDEIKLAKESGVVVAVKLYPAGATTNSQAGVTDLFSKCMPVLEEMAEQGLPLLVHGEVADQDVDIFDRERVFIETVLSPLAERVPHLKIVMEHITTEDAVEFVSSHSNGLLAATVTPQHLLLNRNAIFKGGLQPHSYCLPVLKREKHRQALVSAVTSGSKQYFLGTDSAPHERHTKETSCGCAGIYSSPIALPLYAQVFDQAGALDKLEAFASFNGPLFYGLPRNTTTVTLERVPLKIPTDYKFGSGTVVPMCAGETLEWSLTHQ